MIHLSVNVNKIALLRNARQGRRPDLIDCCRTALRAGAAGITVHPRPDQRHIRADDVPAIAELLRQEFPDAEFNIEGNPFAPANATGYPGFDALVEAVGPTQVTLVPDDDAQLTSDHGWDLTRDGARLADRLRHYRSAGMRTSLFMDAEPQQVASAGDLGADRIELYTGPFAEAFEDDGGRRGPRTAAAMERILAAAEAATRGGLAINAGHDLDLGNLIELRHVPGLAEVSIGHALIADALELGGLYASVRQYLAVLEGAAEAP